MAATGTETTLFVQGTINENIQKAEQAINTAMLYMNTLAQQYTAMQNDAPADWTVDVDIGTQVPIVWNNAVSTIASPVEPDYTNLIPTQISVPAISVPSGVTVTSTPAFEVTLGALPEDLSPNTLGAVATLDPIPLISATIPTMPVSLLDEEFAFTEASYAERLAPEVQAELIRVLGGDMGISQAYWDSLWFEVSNDFAKLQVGELRNARNRGSASYWGLPTEAVLTASRVIQDEGTRKLQQVRLEQAKQQAVFAREDFWQAVQQAIAYENQWIALHNAIQARALTAAEQMIGMSIQVYNANVMQFNAALEAAKLDSSIDDLNVQRILKKHASELAANGIAIEQDKQKVARYIGEYQGWNINAMTQVQTMAEKIKWWNGQVDGHSRYEALKQEKAKTDISNYGALLSRIEAVSRATSTMLDARIGASQFTLANQLGAFDTDVKKNAAALDVGRLTQAAQESRAKLDVAQNEWLAGQGNTLLQNIAQLAVGLAQSLITVSDVNLSASDGFSESFSTTASRNEEKVW